MKKRYFVIPLALLLIFISFGWFGLDILKPVRPFIQLPGECYPGTLGIFGDGPFALNCWTNTFTSAIVAWIVVLVIALSVRAGSRTVDEVPTGFYNFFEMVIEGAFDFVANITGERKARDFFPFFMTYILVILVANWLGLVPGWDSIGLWEHKPFFEEETRIVELERTYVEELGRNYTHDEAIEIAHDEHVFDETDKKNKGDLRSGIWLLSKVNQDEGAEIIAEPNVPGDKKDEFDAVKGFNPDAADWTIVPFVRPAATDLNFTLAFAIIAMVLVQYFGFKYLGARSYLGKFFPFIAKGFGGAVAKNPITVIDVVVGLLELIGDVSKILSFAFRLLGNIFAGMVLLFVMAFLLPAANMIFYGLEFFIGLIQAIVFALLMVIFMNGATIHHGYDDDHGHH